jgi:integrase/recombinase XerD
LNCSPGQHQPPGSQTKEKDTGALDVLVDKYLDVQDGRAAQRNWRKHTLQCYRLGLKLFMQSCMPKTRLEEIDGDDLRNFKVFLRKYRTKLDKPYDDRSIWNHFNNVVSFISANRKRNLVEARDWPKFEKKKVTCYDEADLERLLQFADENEADVLRFFLGVGFRKRGGTHVEWVDIDFKNREIHIYSKREKFRWQVKDSEQRIVGISERLAERLTVRHKRHPGNGLVAPNTMGKPDKHLLRVIKRVALRAGLNCGKCTGIQERKRVTCLIDPVCRKWIIHTARKNLATFQHREGTDVRTIQQDLGHSSLVTTLNYLEAEDRRSAVRRAQINAADARVRQFIGVTEWLP